MKKFRYIVAFMFVSLLRIFVSERERSLIIEDAESYFNFREEKYSFGNFVKAFIEMPEFRSVVYYRLRNRLRYPLKWFFPGMSNLYINSTDIAGGLFFIHGFSTIVNAKKIKRNCMIFQQVTIGFSKEGTPIIGENVTVCSGAIVIGPITIGNNVTIGAGAVVIKDVPDFAIVAGNPARIVGYNKGDKLVGRE